MGRFQPLSAKIGEVKFRQKLVKQHQGKKVYYSTHTSASENLKLLRQRAKNSFKIFKELKKKGIHLSPFLELGGEKCERAAVLTTKMGYRGAVIDLSAESLESASNFCPKIGLSKLPTRICADTYRLPFANNSFSFIFTFQTLHHFPEPAPVLKEIYRVLAPGGYFYFAEEPVKQLINIPLWRRDYHLRWWEKILKFLLILPFISKIGKSEIQEGVLEEAFDFKTWEKALNQFDKVEGEILPYPFGPTTKVFKKPGNWLKPNLTTKILINLMGGGIKALCQKKGEFKNVALNFFEILVCPKCQKKLLKKAACFECLSCHVSYPVINGVFYLLPSDLQKRLYS